MAIGVGLDYNAAIGIVIITRVLLIYMQQLALLLSLECQTICVPRRLLINVLMMHVT